MAALYDFLYKDSARINSYYAQLFKGLLSSIEETEGEKQLSEMGANASAVVASGSMKTNRESSAGNKRLLIPHDTAATDVFSKLMSNGLVSQDIVNAPHGSLIMASGTLVFIDHNMVEVASFALNMVCDDEHKKPKNQRNDEAIKVNKLLNNFLSKIQFPSACLLHTETGIQVAGTIKESGMEEPISSYYFKHGTAGLSDVYLIGVKEIPTFTFSLSNTDFIGAGQQLAQGLSDMLFPASAIRITPIGIFRKLGESD